MTRIIRFLLVLSFFIPSISSAAFFAPDPIVLSTDGVLRQRVELFADGSVLVDNKRSSNIKIDSLADKFVLRYKVIDQPRQVINQAVIELHLPATTTTSATAPEIFAVHGVANYTFRVIDSQTIEYQANGIGPEATVTVVVNLPKSALALSKWYEFRSFVQTLSVEQWFAIGIILPALMIFSMFVIFLRRSKDVFLPMNGPVLQSPPSTLPPAFAGVLIHGNVGVREIAATLIDLARRGYLDIISQADGNFIFSQKRQWQTDSQLHDFERAFLDQLFTKDVFSDASVINQRLNSQIWSDSVTKAIENIYTKMVTLGYFAVDPESAHLSVRIVGILTFFCSVIGMLISLLFFGQAPLIAIPWLVSIVTSPILIHFSQLIPQRTPAGREQAIRWLRYKAFLTEPTAITSSDAPEIYEQHLAYAIVLDCEVEWTQRFARTSSRVPDWFYSEGRLIESYATLAGVLFSIIGFISRRFSVSRRPTAV